MTTILRRRVAGALSQVLARRGFSTDSVCYMMGDKGAIAIEGSVFVGIKEYLKKQPFLSPVPQKSLFGNMGGPYHTEDPIRKMIKSGAINCTMIAEADCAIANPFHTDNVGVHSETGIILFRKFCASEKKPSLSQLLQCFVDLMKILVRDHHGHQALNLSPDDIKKLWSDFCNPDITSTAARDHPTLLSDEAYFEVLVQAYSKLIKEGQVHTRGYEENVLTEIGKKYKSAVQMLLLDPLLSLFLPKNLLVHYPRSDFPHTIHLPPVSSPPVSRDSNNLPGSCISSNQKKLSKKAKRRLKKANAKNKKAIVKAQKASNVLPTTCVGRGKLLISVGRHIVAHSVEFNVVNALQSKKRFGLMHKATRAEILKGARRRLGNLLADVIVAFDKNTEEKNHTVLQISERCTISGIFRSSVKPVKIEKV